MTSTLHIPGLLSGRFLKCLGAAKGDPFAAIAYCEGKHGAWAQSTPSLYTAMRAWPDLMQKSATDPNTTTNSSAIYLPTAIQGDFMPLVTQASALAQLPGVRRFPPNSATAAFTSSSSAAITDEFQRVAVSKAALTTVTLTPKKICGLLCVVNAILLGNTAAAALAGDLARSVAFASDVAGLSPNAPFSISNGATSFASTGSTLAAIDADIFRAFGLSLASTPDQNTINKTWVMSPTGKAFLSMLRGSGQALAYPTVAESSTLLGLPILVTGALSENTSPQASAVLLVSGDQIAVNQNDGIDLSASSQGSILMDDAPASGAQQETSLWQTNATALMALRWLAVARQQASSVVAITGCTWA